jgi:membrane-associated phospholipid phosphatase
MRSPVQSLRSTDPLAHVREVLLARTQTSSAPTGPAALFTLGAFALVTLASQPGGWSALDESASRLAGSFDTGPVGALLKQVYLLGTPRMAVLLTVGLGIVLLTHRRWGAAALLFGAMAFLALVEGFLRAPGAAFLSGNPLGLIVHPFAEAAAGLTYPSGHTSRIALLGGIAAVNLPSRFVRFGLTAAALLSLGMAVELVATGQHTGSDVIGGLLLGAGTVAAYSDVLSRVARW